MQVEAVFALPERQVLKAVELPEGSTVADAIRRSELAREFPEVDFDQLQAGIWGTPVERGRTLLDGDRVELYRPLVMDPREARRLKAGG
jgi:putative ubiquitin-RnfH superfamily antitoxin RatB of RatAB toxin-antitoxin module